MAAEEQMMTSASADSCFTSFYFFSEQTIFFSHNKSVNSIFSHFSAIAYQPSELGIDMRAKFSEVADVLPWNRKGKASNGLQLLLRNPRLPFHEAPC